MARTGRPKKNIDQKQFDYLCSIMCTEEEIAGVFDCSIDTINRWCKRTFGETFADVYKKKSAVGKISLRRSQFRLAETNASMAIFLGKNYLGQRDDRFEMTSEESNSLLKSIQEVVKRRESDDNFLE